MKNYLFFCVLLLLVPNIADAADVTKSDLDSLKSDLEQKIDKVKQQIKFNNAETLSGDRISYPFEVPHYKIEKVIYENGNKAVGETSKVLVKECKRDSPSDPCIKDENGSIQIIAEELKDVMNCIPPGLQFRALGEADKDTGMIKAMVLPGSYKDCDGYPHVESHPLASQLILLPNQISNILPSRKGITYGTLFVPYKLLLAGSKSIKGSTTVGPYIARRQVTEKGVEIKWIGFIGPSLIENSETDGTDVKREC